MAMKFKMVDDDDDHTIEKYILRKYIEDERTKEEKAKKDKEKNKGPKMVTVGYCLLVLMASAPFVGMAMSALLLAVYVKWAEVMKALVQQL